MLKAIKQNKVYPVDESNKDAYLADGFDIYKGGILIEVSPKRVVPYSEYKALCDENEKLKEDKGQRNDDDVLDILRAFANEHGIDLGQSKSVSSIVKKIKEHKPEAGE